MESIKWGVMFTINCFIQGSPMYIQRLADKLEKIGYKWGNDYGCGDRIYLIAKDGTYHYASTLSLYTNDWGLACQCNEDLFLALASLRNDSDKNQWFVSEFGQEWFLSDTDFCVKRIVSSDRWNKATMEQIVKRFCKVYIDK